MYSTDMYSTVAVALVAVPSKFSVHSTASIVNELHSLDLNSSGHLAEALALSRRAGTTRVVTPR